MAYSKQKRRQIYRKLITNFNNGANLADARKDLDITIMGVSSFVNSLRDDGLAILVTGEKGKSFIQFTNKGIEVLKKSFGDDLF